MDWTSPITSRVPHIFRYVLNDGSFPVPPVVMRRPEGLSSIDGPHRMAVLTGRISSADHVAAKTF